MEKLYPIATAATRHLFVDPAIYQPFCIIDPHYRTERSSYLKPGIVPNLMQLCMPEGQYFSVTEEPDFDNMFIDEIMFGMHYQDSWEVFRVPVMFHLEKLDQGNWGIARPVEIPLRSPININTGKTGIELPDSLVLAIDINVHYARGTRRLEITTTGTYDNGKPQILGMCFDLTHLDSKSSTLPFKTEPKEVVQTYRREIVA